MASKSIGLLNIVFGADLRGFDRAMKKAQKNLKKFGSSMKRTGATLTRNLTMPILALGVVGVRAFDKQQKAIAQMEAGLKSTGGQVGITSKELQKMAADLQKTTLFGDEEILKDATAQLLTFTNITGDQFKRTQKVALDLATRLDGDLKSASIMLGKALNDPVANLSALSRAGIQFSKEQKATVKSLVETNRLADAQTIILKELETQYGGSAAAAAAAGLGPIQQLGNALSDMSEDIGSALLPMIKDLANWIKEMAEKFDGLDDSTKKTIVKVALLAAAVGPLLIMFGKMSTGLSALLPILSTLGKAIVANPFLLLAAAIAAIGMHLYNSSKRAKEFSDAMGAVKDVAITAEKSIVGKKLAVERLTKILKNENSTLKEKKKALDMLKKVAPDYYGKLNAAKLDVEALDVATKNYLGTLLAEAKAMASKEKLIEIEKKLLEERQNLQKAQSKEQLTIMSERGEKGRLEFLVDGVSALVTKTNELATGSTEVETYTNKIKDLTAQRENLAATMAKDFVMAPTVTPPRTPPRTPKGADVTVDDPTEEKDAIDDLQKYKQEQIDQDIEAFNQMLITKNKLQDDYYNSLLTQEEQEKNAVIDKYFSIIEAAKDAGLDVIDLEKAQQAEIDKIIEEAAQRKIEAEEAAAAESKKITEDELEEKMKGWEAFANTVGKILNSIGGLQSAQAEKSQVEFDIWKEQQDDRKETLDGEMEEELERIEESGMNEERKATAKADIQKAFGDKKAEIDKQIERKEKEMQKKQAIREKALKIASAIMSTAEAVAANIAFPPLAAFIGALGAVQIATIASTPIPFADGGLVSGATLGLIGEGSGTSAFNPEVVSPLDKLMNIMGSTDVDVHGRIEGNNIVLVSDKAEISRERFI